jgi:hypothetical protein
MIFSNAWRRKVGHATVWVLLAGIILGTGACKVSYSFSGVNISPEVQTFAVEYFPNRAPVVQAQLSQQFTDALIDKVQANTSLELVTSPADVIFSGEISNYQTKPTAITGQETAARNRLTITINVVFTNTVDEDQSFETSFSRYEDYDSSQNLADVENELIELILEGIIEDIFNKAFVNW